MKKIMIAACAVALAAVSQAASISWTINNGVNPVSMLNGCYVYLVTSAGSFSSLEALKAAALTDNNGVAIKGTFSTAGGKLTSATGSSANDAWSDGETVNYYYAILNGTDATATGYWISGAQTATAKGTGTPTQSKATNLGTIVGGTINSFSGGGDTPEPTSATLLLLGVAGLALRRRRA